MTTAEDTLKAITLTATDPEGDAILSYAVVTPPAHGTLSGTAPNLTYTPAANYNGSDSFTFAATDSILFTLGAPATVSINITAVNDGPVAAAQTLTTAEDAPLAITLSATDPEGSAVTYAVLSQPVSAGGVLRGTLSGTAPNLTYTPPANYVGSVSFTFRASDGTTSGAFQTITISITSVEDAPVATPQSYTTREGVAVGATLTGTDAETSSLYLDWTVVTQPAHGTLDRTSGSSGTYMPTYMPNAGFVGTDTFTFKVTDDASVESAPATISITVLGDALGAATPNMPDTLRHSIPVPPVGVQSGAGLGESVAVDGGLMVVGAPSDDAGTPDAGLVKVFNSATGELLHVLPNPTPAGSDYFGQSVAISGTWVVVGAYGDDSYFSNAGSAYVYDLSSATPTVPVHTLRDLNFYGTGGDKYGFSVAISGTRVVVGAYGKDLENTDAGAVYVYDLTSATPTVPMRVVSNPETFSEGDFFGYSVAISGTRVVVGSRAADSSGGIDAAGRVDVFDLAGATSGAPVATFTNKSVSFFDFFGHSVAISGTRVAVGRPGGDTGAIAGAGDVFVYDLASATPTTPVATLANPSPLAGESFGWSVSISGSRVAVGALYDGTGASEAGSAYVYDLGSGTPTVPVHTLNNPTPAASDWFGISVAISGTRVIAGAPGDDTGASNAGSAYRYDLGSATPTTPALMLNQPGPGGGDAFGSSVAISGSWMVIGAPYDDTGAEAAGSVYVYDRSSGTPVLVATLNNPDPAAHDNFGDKVAMSGTRVVVGAGGDDLGTVDSAGRVFVYDFSSATPTTPVFTLVKPGTAVLGDWFGGSLAISGNRVVVGVGADDTGASNAGSAYVFDLSSATPTDPVVVLNNPVPAVNDYFGLSVSVSGSRVVVGAFGDDGAGSNAGTAYVYDLASATPTAPATTIYNPAPAANDSFGYSVAISGNRVVVGAYVDDAGATDAGSVYVYDLSGATPATPVATLNNPGPVGSDRFGESLAISGTRLVVGVPMDDGGGTNAGRVYIYDLLSATPSAPVARLTDPSQAAGDVFGTAVAIDGNTVLIGVPGDDTVMANKGFAYVFAPETMAPAGGTFTVTPASPIPAGTTLTATFAGWTDASQPLSYEVRNGETVLVAAGADTAPTFILPAGTHQLIGRITDASGNSLDAGLVTVTVLDNTAPVISTPAAVTAASTSLNGVAVNFAVSATDNADPAPVVTTTPASGSVFPIGTTTVNVTATDVSGNTAEASFTVTVRPSTTLDTVAPAVAITAPATSSLAGAFTISGTVKENIALASLTVKFNGATLALDAPVAFVKNTALPWSVSGVAPENGSNSIEVEAVDLAGRRTKALKTVTYLNTTPEMAVRAGAFDALLRPAGTPDVDNTGFVTVTVTPTGAFTGKVSLGGVVIPISGVLKNDGTARFKPALGMVFALIDHTEYESYLGALAFSVNGTEGLQGTLSLRPGGPVLGSFTGQSAPYSAANLVPAELLNQPATGATKGIYAVAFPSKDQTPARAADLYPQGDGYASLTLTNAGSVTLAGYLADGTAYTAAGKLRADGTVALFSALYKKEGAFTGQLAFADAENSDASGPDFLWLRSAKKRSRYYPGGWENGIRLDAVGTKHAAPTSLDFGQGAAEPVNGNATLVFADGELAEPLTNVVSVDPVTGAVKMVPAATTAYKLSLAAATGIFSGTFLHSEEASPIFRGILLNKGANKGGFGYFLSPSRLYDGTGQGGGVSLEP